MPVVPINYLGGLETSQTNIDATSRNWYRPDEVDYRQLDYRRMDPVFYRMLEAIGRGQAKSQPKYIWFRDDIPQTESLVNYASGYNTTDATFTVENAAVFTPNMLIMNRRTEELMLITAINSLTSITVTRGYNGTVAAAITDRDELASLMPALSERGTANLRNGYLPVSDYNYIGFYSQKVQVTELQQGTPMQLGIDFPRDVQRAYFQLRQEISRALLWSVRGVVDDATYGRYYYFGGLMQQLKTNVWDLAACDGVMTWPLWNEIARNTTKSSASSDTKVCICGQLVFEAVNMMDYARVQPVVYSEVLGTRVKRVVTDEGVIIDFVLDKWSFPRSHAGMGVIMDMPLVSCHQHSAFPMRVRPNIQANDSHVREDEVYGSESIMVQHEECFAVIKNCKGAY